MANPCGRKRAYSTKAFAEQIAVKRWKRTRFLLTVYRCPDCKRWHVSRFPNGPLEGK